MVGFRDHLDQARKRAVQVQQVNAVVFNRRHVWAAIGKGSRPMIGTHLA
jgi:hypothetical protein